jgi:AcrR family transcriptional regulator
MSGGKPNRRTQESRSAETRARTLETAIRLLYERGYAATNILSVAAEAGISRGALQHQFPTKVDLMLYVVRTVYDQETALYREQLDQIADPRERMLAFPEIAWEVLSRPSGVAVLEILQGSRSDPELAARLRPMQMEIERDSIAQVASIAGAAGVDTSAPGVRLVVWAIRGLSVAQLLVEDPAEIRKSVRLLRRLLRIALDFEQDAKPTPQPESTFRVIGKLKQ